MPVPGTIGERVSEQQLDTHTPGNNKYLANFKVVPLGKTSAPPGLTKDENRAYEANIRQNVHARTFYTKK